MTKETCDKIWNDIVIPNYEEMCKQNGLLICPDCEKEAFFMHYNDIVRHAKEQYMLDCNGVLNRHKVAAAMMISILKTKPIKKVDKSYYQTDMNGQMIHWPFNESLAITLALSVLRAFIIARVDYAFSGKIVSKQIFQDSIFEDKNIFEDGIPVSDSEIEEWEWELYQVRQDGAYNLLSVAHLIKEIEKNCRLEYLLDNNIDPTFPDPKNLSDDCSTVLSIDEIFNNPTP